MTGVGNRYASGIPSPPATAARDGITVNSMSLVASGTGTFSSSEGTMTVNGKTIILPSSNSHIKIDGEVYYDARRAADGYWPDREKTPAKRKKPDA